MSKKTFYYNSFDEDIIKNKNQDIKISEKYKWIHTNILYKICSYVLYSVACIFSFFYAKFILCVKVENKEILKKYIKEGYFIYGNHTQPVGDAFNPAQIFDKRFYVVAGQANLGIPFLGKILPMLGAIIIPENTSGTKEFLKVIKETINKKKVVVIYPEAHVWPYYTKIRPFKESSFDFPIRLNAKSFCMTTTYYKRKNKDKPGIKIYIDGPFLPDSTLPLSKRKEKLCDEIFETMKKRSENSTYEYYTYEERKIL